MDIEPIKIEKEVGYYILDNYCIALYKKPSWFHRTMMKLSFGIIYKDANNGTKD